MSRVLRTGVNQITNPYENHKGWSKGVDVVKKQNQLDDIIAHTSGKVIKVVNYMSGTNKKNDKENMAYGDYVMILHSAKHKGKYVVTLYGHLANVNSAIIEGASVTKGDVLGKMGNTGNSNGAHLHFEIRLYADEPMYTQIHNVSTFEWIDPTPYLDKDLPCEVAPSPKAVGYLDVASWDNEKSKLIVSGWAYKGGGSQKVTIKLHKNTEVIVSYSMTANKKRTDVKSAMLYSTDKVGYADAKSLKLEDGTYTVKAYVGDTKLTNNKTIKVKNPLTAKSYCNYPKDSNKYYYVQKKFKDWSASKGVFREWKNAYKTWNKCKTDGYHVYDNSGKRLD